MAVVTVDTDLSVANGGTINDATSATGWSEPTGSGTVSGLTYADMKSIQTEPDVYIEGTGSISGAWTTNSPERGGIIYNNNGTTVPTDGAILIWAWWIAPLSLDPYATAGIGGLIGDAANSLKVYRLSGNNIDPAPAGGWYCYAINPTNTTAVYENVGSAPSATVNYIGASLGGPGAQSRGLTHFAVDAIRVGRCQTLVTGGTGADTDAAFDLIVSGLDAIDSGAFGIFSSQAGAYFMQGLLQLGDNTSGTGEVVFNDTNKVINIRNTPAVNANFNRIEIQNGSSASSSVTMSGCTFNNLGIGNPIATTASRGDFVVTDTTATVSLTGCAFNDMGTFDLGSGTTASNTSFRRCETITQNGAALTDCVINASVSTVAVIANNPSNITGCSFASSGTGYAIEGFPTANTAETPYVINTNNFSGYGANGTANAALHVTATTGTVYISAPAGTTYTSEGATVTIVADQVTLTLTNIKTGSDIVILEQGTTTKLVDEQDITGTNYAYVYGYAPGTNIDIVIYSTGYVPYYVRGYLLGSSDSSLPIAQVADRNYIP